jgi:excinuclease UvrABC ATPase subunit
MDEPTTGLHLSDIALLMGIIDRLVDAGNSVIVIEHHLDVIRQADWIIDMGPEGGSGGGRVLFEGTPNDLKLCADSITAKYV